MTEIPTDIQYYKQTLHRYLVIDVQVIKGVIFTGSHVTHHQRCENQS